MRTFLSIVFLSTFVLFGQELKPAFPGLTFALEPEGDALSTKEYEACWCYPEYKKGTDTIKLLQPIVYPLPVKKNGVWGLINKNGQKIADFTSEHPFLMTEKGRVVLKGFYQKDYVWKASEIATLTLLDSNGVEKEKYHVATTYKGSFAASKDEKFWGMLNSQMETLVDFDYTPSHHQGEEFFFSEHGYLTLRQNKPGGLNGIVDYKGKVIIPFKWKLLSYMVTDLDHIYAMNDYLKRGYINIKGQTTLSFIFDHIPREITDSNQVTTEKYTWFLDENFKQLGPKYQAYERKGDLWFFKLNGKWGIKDINNETIIPNLYTSIMDGPRIKGNRDFRCYIVVKNGLYGLIDLEGNNIIKPAYGCLCGLGYYAPSGYYIEFKKSGVSYKFSETGELIEKGGKSGGNCFCE